MTHRHLRRKALPGVAVLASLALWGCGGSIGVMESMDGTGVEVCAPQEEGTGRAVIAMSELRVIGDRDVTVTEVALVDPEGLRLLGHDFGAFEDPDFRRVGFDYTTFGPPTSPTTQTLEAGEAYVLKVGLEGGPSGGSSPAVAISYRLNETSRVETMHTLIAMRVAAAGEVCAG